MDEELKTGEVIIQGKSGPVKMFLSEVPKKAKSDWHKWASALALAAAGWLTTRLEDSIASKKSMLDPRDKDLIRLQEVSDRQTEALVLLRIELAKVNQTLDWMKRKVTKPTDIEIQPVITASMPKLDVSIPRPEDIVVTDEELRVYQSTRK